MTTYRKMLLAVLLAVGMMLPAAATYAQRIHIEIGDRPYYTRGPYYWHGGVRYVWVPGHWSRGGRWIHGHYVARERRTPLQRLHDRHETHRRWLFGR